MATGEAERAHPQPRSQIVEATGVCERKRDDRLGTSASGASQGGD